MYKVKCGNIPFLPTLPENVKEKAMKQQRHNKPFGYVLDLIPALLAGPVLFLFFILIFGQFGLNLAISSIIFVVLYAIFALIYLVIVMNTRKEAEKARNGKETFIASLEKVLQKPNTAMIAVDSDGKTVWSNNAANSLFGMIQLTGELFDEYSVVTLNSILADDRASIEIKKDGKYFEVNAYSFSLAEKNAWLITFTDITREVLWNKRYEDNEVCVAYILLDNLAELTAQSGLGEYRDVATLIDGILKQWAESLGAVIKELTGGRYIMIFKKKFIKRLCEDKFPVLEYISSAQKDSFSVPLTVSIGVSSKGDTFEEKEQEALIALDHALQRGGAQVALKRDSEDYEFFGGRTKTSQKRTSIRSRIEADRLISLINTSGNVIVMGHANPDFDAIGATLGLARLAETYGKEAIVVTNTNCENFRISTSRLMQKDDDGYYKKLFADSERGLDSIRSDTLVILADVNSIERCECPEIAQNVAKTAIIDHHRKAGGNSENTELNYIDPSASSACELVSEMLDYSPVRVELDSEEANVMMSGIMLDTQNFVKSVGARTFSAALYLRNCGASNEVASTFFYENMEDYATQTKLTSNVKLYRKKYIIAVNALDSEKDARTAAAKAANKLLSLRGAEACFVLACVGDTVMISARSKGKINVQLILEKMGGGGHFDAAGAQLKDTSESTLTKLQRAIDDYETGKI